MNQTEILAKFLLHIKQLQNISVMLSDILNIETDETTLENIAFEMMDDYIDLLGFSAPNYMNDETLDKFFDDFNDLDENNIEQAQKITQNLLNIQKESK